MKKVLLTMVMCAALAGCAKAPVMETIADELVPAEPAAARQVTLELPPEAASPVWETEEGICYRWEDCDILLQTLPAGNLDATVRQISGYSPEQLTVVKSAPSDARRYDLVWSSMGQEGEMVGRAAVLDDGNYHYVLTVLSPAESVQNREEIWETLFQSFALAP